MNSRRSQATNACTIRWPHTATGTARRGCPVHSAPGPPRCSRKPLVQFTWWRSIYLSQTVPCDLCHSAKKLYDARLYCQWGQKEKEKNKKRGKKKKIGWQMSKPTSQYSVVAHPPTTSDFQLFDRQLCFSIWCLYIPCHSARDSLPHVCFLARESHTSSVRALLA